MDKSEYQKPYLSIIIPAYNEEQNVYPLFQEITLALHSYSRPYEIIFVDDGSTDRTCQVLKSICQEDSHVKSIIFRSNFGQTAALSAGFDIARGEVIVSMDGDRQNDPADILMLVDMVENQDYDVVCGWRRKRKDAFLMRKLPSLIANRLIAFVTRVFVHDYGCTLKVYKREIIKNIRLYGEMHRFIPAYASWLGARVTEAEVNHRPRTAGTSKYSILRITKVILDLITVKFLCDYSTSPIYFFGTFGMILAGSGFLTGLVTLIEKYYQGIWVHKNPLILLAILLCILGVQFIMIGLLAEILIRTYHESQDKKTYIVKEIVNRS
ncbi:MAG: glycosyltransferase family 2 protein [bacterium]